jgi:L-serine dehydratase
MPQDTEKIRVTLYGSLALTGHGHKSQAAIGEALKPLPVEIVLSLTEAEGHPNTMLFEALKSGKVLLSKHYASLGGGEITSTDDPEVNEKDIYPFRDLDGVKAYMAERHLATVKDFALEFEDSSIISYFDEVLKVMFSSLEKGLKTTGPIPANNNPRLQVNRNAPAIYANALKIEDEGSRRTMLISAYAYAVAEESACGGLVVTAPTCGSSGVLPAILYYEYHDLGHSYEEIRDSLFVAGLFGNIVKQNASISGAIGGCQAEIGTATSMGAAALSFLEKESFYQTEYAAECAMEHFLGLSCDPVDGFVIIPCIERNGMGACRAVDAFLYARYIAPLKKNQVSFDNVVKAMKLTGDSLTAAYKETAEGGLAEILKDGR